MTSLKLMAAAILALACTGSAIAASPPDPVLRKFTALFVTPVIVCDTSAQIDQVFNGFAKSTTTGGQVLAKLNQLVDSRREHACRFEVYVALDLVGHPTVKVGAKRADGSAFSAIVEPVEDSITKVGGWLLWQPATPPKVTSSSMPQFTPL